MATGQRLEREKLGISSLPKFNAPEGVVSDVNANMRVIDSLGAVGNGAACVLSSDTNEMLILFVVVLFNF